MMEQEGTSISESIFHVQELVDKEGIFPSPIDISIGQAQPLELPKLIWHGYDNMPTKLKITNTGHTTILSAKWPEIRPFLTDGPLMSSFIFSQFHFHWGDTDLQGSEHKIEGKSLPLEMHVVHYNSTYKTQEDALKEKDGIVVACYFFELQPDPNPDIQIIIDVLPYVEDAHTSARLTPISIDTFFSLFIEDYLMYWGSVKTTDCDHSILWFVSRQLVGISSEQLEVFRTMKNADEENLTNNFREVQPLGQRTIFHVCPGNANVASTLLPLQNDLVCAQ